MKKTARDLTVADVVKGIGIPVKEWSGNCYAIACAILRARLVKGRPAYGHWTGPVSRRSPFSHRGKVPPIVRHGWIILENGAVLDPTRWVFEAAAPYLFVGMQSGDADCTECGYKEYEHGDEEDDPTCSGYRRPEWPYDEGGDKVRAALQRPFPPVGAGEPVCVKLPLAAAIRKRLGLPVSMTRQQAAWVANLPYSTLAKDAWAVCVALEAAGLKAYVPLDTWTRADAERGL